MWNLTLLNSIATAVKTSSPELSTKMSTTTEFTSEKPIVGLSNIAFSKCAAEKNVFWFLSILSKDSFIYSVVSEHDVLHQSLIEYENCNRKNSWWQHRLLHLHPHKKDQLFTLKNIFLQHIRTVTAVAIKCKKNND